MIMSKKLFGTIKNATDALTNLVQEYSAIGTPDECRAAMEKQIPKKPMISYDERVKENWCSCGVCAFGFGWKRIIHYKYCPDCGQAIDWSDTK